MVFVTCIYCYEVDIHVITFILHQEISTLVLHITDGTSAICYVHNTGPPASTQFACGHGNNKSWKAPQK